jgi:hypothetical protein
MADCCVCHGVSPARSALASWVTTDCQSNPEARPEMAREELPALAAVLPVLAKALELRKDPRLELLVDVTLAIFSFFLFVHPVEVPFIVHSKHVSSRNPGRRLRAVREFQRFIKRAD